MRSIKTGLLVAASISFIIVIGGGSYEHMNVVPRWKLAPPASLIMFQGPYGLNQGAFWMVIHPITLALLIAALVANWKTARKKNILVTLGCYLLIIAITAIYFVPELMAITHTPYTTAVDTDLVARAGLWEKLSLLRLAFMVFMAGNLLLGLTKGNENVGKMV